MNDETKKPEEQEKKAKKPRAKRRTMITEESIPLDIVRTYDESRYALRQKVKMFYDLQRMRMQVEGRITPKAEGAKVQLHAADLGALQRRCADLAAAEKNALADVEEHLRTMPFYVAVLSDKERYKGIGATLAAVILSEFNIHREDTVSKMWAFAGLRPIPARRCKECHVVVVDSHESAPGVEVLYRHVKRKVLKKSGAKDDDGKPVYEEVRCSKGEYVKAQDTYESAKQQRPEANVKLPYNAWLRAKLCGVLGPSLLKADSPWRSAYDGYKARWVAQGKGVNDGHRHAAAIRFMVKMLLLDVWKAWRAFEKLPVRPSYQEEKLGHKHHEN